MSLLSMDPAITPKRATCGSSRLATRGQLPFGNTGEIATHNRATLVSIAVRARVRARRKVSVKGEIEVFPFLRGRHGFCT
jgi:hypothetical protein